MPANFKPLFSSLVTFISSSSTFSLYFPNLGSTIFSVTIVPKIVISNVETIMKYQLPVIATS